MITSREITPSLGDDQADINGDIQAIRCALSGLEDNFKAITCEDRRELCKLYIRFGDLILKDEK